MKHPVFSLLLSLSLLLSTCLPPALANQSNAASAGDPLGKSFTSRFLSPGSYMSVSELRPGMKGYGLSVFKGTQVEKFDFTVIGVIKKVLSGRDGILVRLSGPAMANNCVIRGMSGSPLYINGKIIGAVSFGYDFSKEPIAGVTPIVDMLDALVESEKPGETPTARLPVSPLGTEGTLPSLVSPKESSGSSPRLVPLISPISLAGFSPRAERFLQESFRDSGILFTSGGGGGLNPTLSSAQAAQIKPGAAVSVLLSTGDFCSVATGTATGRFGSKVIAFGHPFMSSGAIDFPMATAYVHQVLPSLASSFKLASPLSEVGQFNSDRPWAIGGKLGAQAKLIPASLSINDEMRRIQKTYNCRVVNHPDLTPQLLTAITMSAIDATHQVEGPYVVSLESRIEAEGIEPIVRVDRFAGGTAGGSFSDFLAMLMGGPVPSYVMRTTSRLTNNPYKQCAIKSIKLKVSIEDGNNLAEIDRVYLEKSYAAPGEQVKVLAVIRPFNQEPYVETLSFQIPRDMPDGNLPIGVAGGEDLDIIRSRLAVSDPKPISLKQIVERLQDRPRGDQLSLCVALPEQNLIVEGTTIPDPPSHWSRVLFSNRHTKGPQISKGELKSSKLYPLVLKGAHILTVEVRSKDKATARSAPAAMTGLSSSDYPAMTELARKTIGSSGSRKSGAQILSDPKLLPLQDAFEVSASTTAEAGTVAGSTTASTSTTSSGSSKKAGATLFVNAGKGYLHTRLAQVWRLETEEDFHNGKTEGSSIDSWGRVGPGFDTKAQKAVNPELTIWSATSANGYFYYSTTNKIYRWRPDNNGAKPELVTTLDTTLIPALTSDSAGNIYAACVPEGEVRLVSADGSSVKTVVKTAEPVITALCTDPANNLYIGTAGAGKVYKYDKTSSTTLLFDSGQAHVLCLFYCKPESKLYLGTGESGSVYAIDQNGKAGAVYQSPEHLVTGVAKNSAGDLYVATAAQGRLVRVTKSGETQTLASSEAFYKLHYDEASDSIFSGDAEGDITLARLEPITKQPFFMPVCHTDQEAVLALASNGNELFAGSSNVATIRSFLIGPPQKPLYESAVKDAGRNSHWARLRASGPFTEQDQSVLEHVKVETRTGQTAMADETWSPWTPASVETDSYKLNSPPGRYFQFRLIWQSTVGAALEKKPSGPNIGRVDVIYQPGDQAPLFSTVSLKAGGAVSGKQEISVTGTDADNDNLLCSISLSADGGSTWTKVANDLRSKAAKKDHKSTTSSESSASQKKSQKPEDKDDKSNSSAEESAKPNPEKKEDPKSKTSPLIKKLSSAWQQLSIFNLPGLRPLEEEEKDPNKDPDKDKPEGGDNPDNPPKNDPDEPGNKDKEKKDPDKAEDKPSDSKNESKDKEADKEKKHPRAKGTSSSSESTGAKSSESSGGSTETFNYSWDTAKLKDGAYILKFSLDDRLSSPDDSEMTINLRAVTVDNTAPEILKIESSRPDREHVTLKVVATDKTTAIVNGLYKIDDGDWFALSASPQNLDGLTVQLSATDVHANAGSHKVEIKVSDKAGNSITRTHSIK